MSTNKIFKEILTREKKHLKNCRRYKQEELIIYTRADKKEVEKFCFLFVTKLEDGSFHPDLAPWHQF
jgi:hypothetical protein